MSLQIRLTCDGHRSGAGVDARCRADRTIGLAYSPSLRSDDHARTALALPSLLDGWRIGAAIGGGDLCPRVDHEEDARARQTELDQARQTLEARRANDGLT